MIRLGCALISATTNLCSGEVGQVSLQGFVDPGPWKAECQLGGKAPLRRWTLAFDRLFDTRCQYHERLRAHANLATASAFIIHEAALRHHVIMFDPGRHRSGRSTKTPLYERARWFKLSLLRQPQPLV
jgi:hypothetical protein